MAGFIGGGGGINNAQTFVRLKPLRERRVSAEIVVQRINEKLPKVPGARMRLFVDQDLRFGGRGGGGGGGGGFEYTLLADDTQLLRTWAERVNVALKELPQLTGFDDELVSSQ
jgi:multidrug efflux pump